MCVATNVAGVDRKFFNIKLLRKADKLLFFFYSFTIKYILKVLSTRILDANFYLSIAKTQEILSEEYQHRRSQRKNAAIEDHDDVLDDLDIEEIREIRHLYDVKERIRIREQQKARKHHSIKNI